MINSLIVPAALKLFWAEGYNSITWHNLLLVDYSKGAPESKGIYWIYKISLTATASGSEQDLRIHAQW